VKAIVVKWYLEEMRINPNKKDVIDHQVGKHMLPTSFKRMKQDSISPYMWFF
jgi:hypothetical protein